MRGKDGPLGPSGDWSVRRARVGSERVICAGELDLRCRASLQQELDAALADANDRVTVDLSEVTFMDWTALGVLISTTERAGRGSVLLVHPSRVARRLLAVTGTGRLFGLAQADEFSAPTRS